MPNAGTVLLKDVLVDYANHLHRRPISDNTRKAFLGDVRIFVRDVGEDRPIYKTTGDQIRDWLTQQERSQHAGSPKSVERRLTSLKVFFDWAHTSGYLAINPADPIAYRPLLDPLPEYLTEAQTTAVVMAAQQVASGEKLEIRPLTVIMLVLETGMKKSEVLNLTLTDIDRSNTETPSVWVRYKQRHLKFKNRSLAISKDCLKVIDEQIARFACVEQLFTCTGRNLEYLFNRRVAPLANISSLTFEMLRWTSALVDFRSGDMNDDQMRFKYGLSPAGWLEMQAKLERIQN